MTRTEIARKVQGQSPLTVELVHGRGGYWYFTAVLEEDGKTVFYETETVEAMRLSDLPAATWIEYGSAFLAGAEAKAKERNAWPFRKTLRDA